jgi:hypothetical protein
MTDLVKRRHPSDLVSRLQDRAMIDSEWDDE